MSRLARRNCSIIWSSVTEYRPASSSMLAPSPSQSLPSFAISLGTSSIRTLRRLVASFTRLTNPVRSNLSRMPVMALRRQAGCLCECSSSHSSRAGADQNIEAACIGRIQADFARNKGMENGIQGNFPTPTAKWRSEACSSRSWPGGSGRPLPMPKKLSARRRSARNMLRLPDLDHSKNSVLQSLGSSASKRTYAFAINDFIAWYCSESTLAFGRTVVLRYRYELEARRLAPATINLRLAAVRRLAYEAADNGLLSPDLAASIRRVKGAKRLGTRLGNWLTCIQGRNLLEAPDRDRTKGKRDHAILALLLGCGLRRAELISLKLTHLPQRDDHWAIVDLFGKGGHVRTVPVPGWVKAAIDDWLAIARIEDGRIFRCVTHSGTVWGSGISEKVVWWVVR